MAKLNSKGKSRDGYRYEVCRECGKEWNIARGQYIPPAGYLCPACTYGRKEARAHENSTEHGAGRPKRQS